MTDLNSISDIVNTLKRDSRFKDYDVMQTEQNWVEVRQHSATAIVAMPALWRDSSQVVRQLHRCGMHRTLLVCVGSHQDMARVASLRKQAHLTCLVLPTSVEMLQATLETSLSMVTMFRTAKENGEVAERTQYELNELIAIARAINSERDINQLLGLILEKSRYVTGADAGSVYVLVPDPKDAEKRLLRFEVAQNESLDVDFEAFAMEVSERSIVGAAVIRREIINIPDLDDLERHNPWGVEHDRSFDDRTGYRTRSVLSVPLINHRDQVIGVIQLINKKTTPGAPLQKPADFDKVIPFDEHSVTLCNTLASQAAISLENALLYNELQQVFDRFVHASVQAIESRDPTTSGHSRRVADLTVGLAEVVGMEERGPYAQVCFSPEDIKAIEYAGLLHDFGKIGVPEAVLVKGNKLYEWQQVLVKARFDYIRQWLLSEMLKKKLDLAIRQGSGARVQLNAMEDAFRKQEEYLGLCLSTIMEANKPTVLDSDQPRLLREIAQQTYVDPSGEDRPYLLPQELECLSIPRGSLNEEERGQIQSHVIHTYNYLCSIPWGVRFSQIPHIAGDHHEKLDGSGYPLGKPGREIPVQAKMMAIADIFDALTASDRPYKKAVPWERALSILEFEVKDGKLDQELFRMFVEAKIYTLVESGQTRPYASVDR